MKTLAITAIAALTTVAGSASADIVRPALRLDINGPVVQSVVDRGEGMKTLDVSGISHVNVQGSSFSRVIEIDIGAGDLGVNGIAWDLWADTTNPNFLEKARISIVNSDGNGVTIAPFHFDMEARGDGEQGYHSEGYLDLNRYMLGFLERDGQLRVEFHLTSNPIAGPELTYFGDSTLSVDVVPAPGAFALLGMGGVAAARRRRR